MPARQRAIAFSVAAAAMLTALAGSASAQAPFYRSGFAQAANPGWSASRTTATHTGDALLGPFRNEQVSLSLDALPRHTAVVVALDVHIVGRWTGEPAAGAPATTLTVTLDDGTLLHASLANDDGTNARRQSFPDEPGVALRPAGLGAYRLNALSRTDERGRPVHDSVYRLVLSAPHAQARMKLTLAGEGLRGDAKDAWWAIDNAVVYAAGDDAEADRARAAAREAVARTALGLPEPMAQPPALPPLPSLGQAGATTTSAPAWRPDVGNLSALEASLKPVSISSQDSILAGAIDAQVRAALTPTPPADEPITLAIGREMALLPRESTVELQPPAEAPPARLEQPVTRRVSALVYQSRFATPPGPEWDRPLHGQAPRGERFVGPFGNGATALKLRDIPLHDQLIIDADFYAIGDWQGDAARPSKLTVTVDGLPVLAETFANDRPGGKRTQSYPSTPGGRARPHLPGSDSAAMDALGFASAGDTVGDSSYRLRFVVPHAAHNADVRFAASGLPEDGKAAWGVDNVTVVSAGDRAMSYFDATGIEPDDNADDGDYMNPFVRQPGKEWSAGKLVTSPSGEMFLGGLHNQPASLTVRNFPQHNQLTVAADVVVVGDWQGNTPDPSRFSITLSDGTVLLATSFATDGGESDATQDYPDHGPGRNLPGAGAASVGTMGYKDARSGTPRDAVYRLVFTVPHSNGAETFTFKAEGLRGDAQAASWGLDNVTVTTSDAIYASGGGGGMSLGDAGLGGMGNSSGGTLGGYAQGDPLGGNPYIPNHPGDPAPSVPGEGGGGGGGGGGPTAPALPSPGTAPALLVGVITALRRGRR